jgi:hypothetical protein
MANFKDGLIRDGDTVGHGKILGNIKDGVIRAGGYDLVGHGRVVGNAKNGVIRAGIGNAGTGSVIGNVKEGIIKVGNHIQAGFGEPIGHIDDCVIKDGITSGIGKTIGKVKGAEVCEDEEIVAAYHFLVKEILKNTVTNQGRTSSTKAKTTRTSNAMDNVGDARQLGELIFNKFFSLLESFFGKTGARIIVFAIILYIFRDFFIALFTTAEPPPIRCAGLCENYPKPPL